MRAPRVFSQIVKTAVIETSHQPICTHNRMHHRRFRSQKQLPKFGRDEICAIIRAHYTFILQEWQLNSIETVLNEKDVIVTASIDGGKTVTFQGLSFIVENGIILVIEPTKALISNQIE